MANPEKKEKKTAKKKKKDNPLTARLFSLSRASTCIARAKSEGCEAKPKHP
jgi:hypothetical protein